MDAICPALCTTAASKEDGSRHLLLMRPTIPDPPVEARPIEERELTSVLMSLSSSESPKNPSHEPSATGVKSGVIVRDRERARALSRESEGEEGSASLPSAATSPLPPLRNEPG